MPSRAFDGGEKAAVRWQALQPGWWDDHYITAVDRIVSFLGDDGIPLEGARVLDLGCGDGVISLGLLRRANAASVTGVDLAKVDEKFLKKMAKENGVEKPQKSDAIEFLVNGETTIPAEDCSVDVVTAWSVFEHVARPTELLRDVYRVLRPGGVFFLQIWPLWNSEHGSHLWSWFETPFQQHLLTPEEIKAAVLDATPSEALGEAMFDLYASCNKIDVDALQESILDAGFFLAKVELDSSAFHVPEELQQLPLSKIGISGITLMAVRQW